MDTYGPPVFAPDYSATGLAAKMWTNSQWAFYIYYISMVYSFVNCVYHLSNWQKVQLNTDLLKHGTPYLYTKETGQLKLNEKERVSD